MMSDNIYEENGDDQRNEETTPLMLSGRQDSVESGNNTTNNKRKRNSSVRLSVIAILIGSLCGMAIIAWGQRQQQQRKRRNEGQTIVIAKPDGNNTTPEAVGPEEFSVSNSYRPICEYYYYGTSDTTTNPPPPPRILQTSMYEPSKPWSVLEPCRRASDPTTVQLNVAGNPDAILLVNFSTPTTSTATTDSSTAAVHSRPTILGFGGAFTEASALNFARLSALGQESVLELLFGRTGLGYSLGRMPIHSCDFAVAPYTFDDRVDDMELKQFKVSHDVPTIFRLAQAAVQTYQAAWIRPRSTSSLDNKQSAATSHSIGDDNYVSGDDGFRLFASPWSPPAWMKRPTWQDSKNATHATSMMYSAQPNCLRDGVGPDSLYAATWARYISKFVTALRETTGLRLWAVTVQNEPEFAAPWEACAYTATNMTDFVAYHLGPVLSRDHADLKILAFDHNKDHINTWMMTMLNGTASSSDQDTTTTTDSRSRSSSSSSSIAAPYIAGTAYHWYAGGMDRLLDGALGIANLHRLRENLGKIGHSENHILLGTESCHCPTTGYAGGNINIYWDRAERYAHTILADLAAGSQGWVEWNLILDGIGGPNHLGNLCEATILAVPHRALDAANSLPPLPDFEKHSPMGDGGRIVGDERTREELNALGFPAKYLDVGIAVQPMYYYMGHISRHVRPGSVSVPGLVRQSLGNGEIFRPVGATVAGGGENDLARDGIELLLWPCEGSTRQQFRWDLDDTKRLSVMGHDWLGNQTKSCVGREVDKDLMGMRLTQCKASTAGMFDVVPIADDKEGRYFVKLLNHPQTHLLCLVILELKNGGGSYGPLGGAQLALGDCADDSAKWFLDLKAGTASSTYFSDENNDNNVCITTGWPFLQMGAFLTPNGTSPKTVVILNEAKDSANYALKDDGNVVLTGSIPPRSIQTLLLN